MTTLRGDMAITREQVLHVMKLAHLKLSEPEIERMIKDLGSILGHVDQLAELDTTNVAPTTHLLVTAPVPRKDEAQASLTNQVALKEAPRNAAGGFAVPGFMDDT